MMDNNTKVMLSASELALVTDKNVILTKQAIFHKAAALFNDQIDNLSILFKEVLVDEALLTAIPKISRGENYKSYPYIIMDYPAAFSKQNIFALRTMFWWGNFVIIILHLKGTYKEYYTAKILQQIKSYPGFYISVGEDEWQHDFVENNYIKSEEINEESRLSIEKNNFFKIALKYELHHWNMMQSLLPEGYQKIKNLLIY